MVAFSVDILSFGNPSLFHLAIRVSFVNNDKGSNPSVIGMVGSTQRKNGSHCLCNRSLRNCLVKQPT